MKKNTIWQVIWNRLRDPFYNKEWAEIRAGLERRHRRAMDCLATARHKLDRGDVEGMKRAYEEFDKAKASYDAYAARRIPIRL